MSRDLNIILFAGCGGSSIGVEAGTGRLIDVAINHSAAAIATHAVNHRKTRHFQEDVFAVKPLEVCRRGDVAVLWASPDCRHFSKAKGGKPVEKKIRGLAWVVARWAKEVRPRVIFLENVEEFRDWGPLGADGKPDRKRRGLTYRRFTGTLRNLGYQVEDRILVAADYGAPTTRRRLYMVARCDGEVIVWPEPTHAKPGAGDDLFSRGLKPWRAAAECIDWSIPCPSIFERKKPLAEKTLRRIAAGLERFLFNDPEPFIVTNTTGNPARGVGDPLKTQTSGNHHYLVTPALVGVGGRAGDSRPRGMDEPVATMTSKADVAIAAPVLVPRYTENDGQAPRASSVKSPMATVVPDGNGATLVNAHLTKFRGGAVGSSAGDPVPTITAGAGSARPAGAAHALGVVAAHVQKFFGNGVVGREADAPLSTVTGTDHQALAAAFLTKYRGTNVGTSLRDPVPTITGQGTHIAEVRAFLVAYYGNDRDGQSLRKPMRTVTAKDRLGIVTIHGEDYQIVDIGLRMLTPRELMLAQGFPPDYVLLGTKSQQVSLIGNSVCPPVAEALVRANCGRDGAVEAVA